MHRALGRRSRGSDFGRFGRQTEVEEDLADDGLVAEERQQAARSAAVGADQGVLEEDPLEELGPEVVPPPLGGLSRGVGDAAIVRPARGAGVPPYGCRRTFRLGVGRSRGIRTPMGASRQRPVCRVRRRCLWQRHDAAAVRSSGREHTEVVDEFLARSRHQRGEACEEREWVEDDTQGAVTPDFFERVGDPAIGQDRQPFLGDGRSCDVADQVLEAIGATSLRAVQAAGLAPDLSW